MAKYFNHTLLCSYHAPLSLQLACYNLGWLIIINGCCIIGKNIDGEAFLLLTREDFGIIFPSDEKFLLASRLYRVIQQTRMTCIDLLDELSDLEVTEGENSSFVSYPSSSRSTHSSKSPSSSLSSTSKKRVGQTLSQSAIKRKCVRQEKEFQLPTFSPDLKQCIRKDAFYTSTQRNRLIKESCVAIRGHFWEQNKDITNSAKTNLAKMLYNLAPKSLGDTGMDSAPHV